MNPITTLDRLLPIIDVPEYQAVVAADFQHASGCTDPDTWFTAEPHKGPTQEERGAAERTVERLREILVAVPPDHPLRHETAWVGLVRHHVGTCDTCNARVERLGVLVRLMVDGVRVEREYRLLDREQVA